MKKNSIKLLILLCICSFNTNIFSQTSVTKDNFTALGWGEYQTHTAGTPNPRRSPSDFIKITCGPANTNPFLQPGSAFISFPRSTNPTLLRVILGFNPKQKIKLSDITELKYSTYTVKTPNNTPDPSGTALKIPMAPVLLLQIDMDGEGPGIIINNINFFPEIQMPKIAGSNYAVIAGDWQEWNVLDPGAKWTFIDRSIGPPGVQYSWQAFVNKIEYKEATIVNNDFITVPNGGAGIRFLITDNPLFLDYTGYIDGFTLKDKTQTAATVYDFDIVSRVKKVVCHRKSIEIGIESVPGYVYTWESVVSKGTPVKMAEMTSLISVSPNRNTRYILTETGNDCVYKTIIEVEVNKGICPPRPWWWWPAGALVLVFTSLMIFRGIKWVNNSRKR